MPSSYLPALGNRQYENIFLSFQASYFSITNQSTNHLLFDPPRKLHFSNFMSACWRRNLFVGPVINPEGAKMASKTDQMAPKAFKKHLDSSMFRGPGTNQPPRGPKATFWITNSEFCDPPGSMILGTLLSLVFCIQPDRRARHATKYFQRTDKQLPESS